jgi:hypothetical protein
MFDIHGPSLVPLRVSLELSNAIKSLQSVTEALRMREQIEHVWERFRNCMGKENSAAF